MSEPAPLVLDTHVWIWLMAGDPSLGETALVEIQDAARRGRVLVPAIAVWEVAMLEQRGRIVLAEPALQWVKSSLAAPGLTLAPLTPEIAVESCNLPDSPERGTALKDPADRMIVATARIEHATLITRDERILTYGAVGHVSILAA
jgi:PIN domain nuclease of toxin-antitoxin system